MAHEATLFHRNTRSRGTRFVAALIAAVLAPAAAAPADDAPATLPKSKTVAKVDPDHARAMAKGLAIFEGSVRSILVSKCLDCHGGKATKGEFDLTTRDALLAEGTQGPNVVPGKAAESRLVAMLAGAEKPRMPYKLPALAADEVERIRAWIDAGAPYDRPLVDSAAAADRSKVGPEARAFWSFQPIRRVAPPEVRGVGWPRTAVDRFILAPLEAKGLEPAPEADRRTLIRRVALDLIGLPPTPEEIAAFLADKAPDAYERMVDRLLENRHFGERWARHWLDLARFAESHGYEQDYDRPHAYHFRDFVIRAFNADMPYDRFVKLQIAGDEIAPGDPEALRATGYLGCGTHATQITANQVEKERYDELDDMAANVGTTMLGLTIGCARCHDHKFDPIPTRDYYRMISNFTTAVRSEQEIDPDPLETERLRAEHRKKHEPLVATRDAYDRDRLPAALEARLAAGLSAPRPRWLIVEPKEARAEGGTKLEKQADGSLLASGANPKHQTYTFLLTVPAKTRVTSLRVEALRNDGLVKGGPGRADNGNFALSRVDLFTGPADKRVALPLVAPRADFEQKGLPAAAALDDDPRSGWAVDPEFGKDHAIAFDLAAPFESSTDATLELRLAFAVNDRHAIARPRLSLSVEPTAPGLAGDAMRFDDARALARIVALPAEKRSADDRARLLAWFRDVDPERVRLQAAVDASLRAEPKPRLVKVQITSEGVPAIRFHTQGGDFFEKTYFLERGDLSKKRGEADAGFLQVLTSASDGESRWKSPPPAGAKTSHRRRALAEWITDVDAGAGRLLARVIVNRLWLHHMGRGIVNTPSDFGTQGDRPTHPELLDYLADELIRGGWRLKPIHRLIVTSAVYRQSTHATSEAAGVDLDGSLYSRRLPARLSAEVIRDSMLALGGKLDRTLYGPGSLDEAQPRRSIYYTIKRSKLIPLMILFDAPDSLQGIGKRPNTTVAPQALAMLNNKQIRSYAAGFASTLAGKAPEAAIAAAFERALGREPSDSERADALDFLRAQAERYRGEGKSDADAQASSLIDFCHSLMCLNEFVYVN
ncbi:MAG: PSD1 and planctomycete cytochrome C domain-containing protein [Isosphaeraceae bacterium]|nr:PSD1 and planctomycete cytochrome C domain-containing protein [Isosphaeraceae bacterium]